MKELVKQIFPTQNLLMDTDDLIQKKQRLCAGASLDATGESKAVAVCSEVPGSVIDQVAFFVDDSEPHVSSLEPLETLNSTVSDAGKPIEQSSSSETAAACRFFGAGYCAKGSLCEFRHSVEKNASIPCQYYIKGNCLNGSSCRFSHAAAPRSHSGAAPVCKFFGTLRGCKNPSCPFRHESETVAVPVGVAGLGEKILEKYSSVKKADSLGVEAAVHRRKDNQVQYKSH